MIWLQRKRNNVIQTSSCCGDKLTRKTNNKWRACHTHLVRLTSRETLGTNKKIEEESKTRIQLRFCHTTSVALLSALLKNVNQP